IIILIGIVLYRLYNPVVQNYLFLQREKEKLLQQKDNMQNNTESLQAQIKASEEEMSLEEAARVQLNMKKSGEGMIIVSETVTTKVVSKTPSILLWERIKDWFLKKN
ncbi:MAG: septum formation initiator family protein, partial [Candidatus Parcubacteria bacterium]|nr:septum formation initiator family protein [Candidatus Parcubacteria bacterium]